MFALDQQMKPELSGISTPLWVHQMDIVERMSGLWEIELVVRSESPDLDLEAPIGRPARLALTGRMKTQVLERTFSGICTKLGQVRVEADGASTYAVSLRPALWALTQRTNYRLFQHLTVVEIANALLDEWEIERELRLDLDRYPVLELRTQYGESDHAFLARLLEEFGISYFFEEAGGTAKLVLSDNPGRGELRAQPLPYTDDPSLHAVTAGEFATKGHVVHRALPGAFASRDYDFRRPGYRLFTSTDAGSEAEARWEQFDYTPGGYLHEHNEGGQTPHADDKGPGRHEEGFGKKRTELAMLRTRAEKASYQVDSNVIDLAPGRLFTVVDHPHPAFGESLLVIENRIHRDDEEEESFTVTTRAVPASVPYFPPITIDKPRVEAVQTATVVGPEGEEIHTDEYGRVRVQFPWDRYGTMNEESSCWMRVNQGWAGAAFGSLNLPRIGQDVLVAFLDGNPDHPILVGRVFNESSPVPYKLPENKTVSTWKSNSSPSNGGFNELRFEDAAGRELVYFQAQKDSMGLVKNDEMLVVGNDRSRLVRGHETETIAKNHTRMVQGNVSDTVGENTTKTVGKNRAQTIGDSDTSIVGKLFSVTIGRTLADPLGQAFSSAYQAMGPVLQKALTSTLGEVPSTALGAPLLGNEQGPMASLAKSLLPQAMNLLNQGMSAVQKAGGRPPTNISMVDEQIVLTTGGASIILKGDDIILSAAGEIKSTSGKDTKIFAKSAPITIQGGPMVYINPGEKSDAAMKMAQASHAGAAFVGGAH